MNTIAGESVGWEDGHGHLTELRSNLSPEETQSAMVISRVLSKQSITAIIGGIDIEYSEAVNAGADESSLHMLGQKRDIFHMAQLHAVEHQLPPAA